MSAAIVAGELVPAHLREFANDLLRADRDELALEGDSRLRVNLTPGTLTVKAHLALRIESQLTIESAVRHASPRFVDEFTRAEELGLALWATGCADWLVWSDLDER